MLSGFNTLRRYEKHFLRGLAFSIPISIGLSQICYFAFLIVAVPNFKKSIKLAALRPLRSQLICWIVALVIATCASVNFTRSLSESFKGILYPLFVVLVLNFIESLGDSKEKISEIYQLLLFLIVGQTIASIATVISLSIGSTSTFGLPGPVTGSGQLALVLPIVMGIVLATKSQVILSKQRALGVLMFALIVLSILVKQLSFSYCIPFQIFAFAALIFTLKELNFFSLIRQCWKANTTQISYLIVSLLPFLVAAFVFNLKRGPWIGVLLSTIFLGMVLGRRRIIWGVIGGGISMLLIPAVRLRVLNLIEDFTIAGGRERMWAIGLEIASRFPLGVGPKNVVYMRVLDPYLPPTHRHLHNNILNVVVETGYIGGVVFIWWMATLVYLGFRWASLAVTVVDPTIRRASLIAVSMSTAILSWQCAGFFEYNFGDAEIKMLSFLLMGLLLSLNYYLDQASKFSNDVKDQ